MCRGENCPVFAMDSLRSRSDGSGSPGARLIGRLAAADRGWKATGLGLGITVALAVGPP